MLFNGARLAPSKFGNVGTCRQLDTDRVVRPLTGIIEPKPLTNLACLDPDRGVFARVVGCRPSEHLDTDGALFQDIGLSVEGVLDDVAKEFLAALTRPELVACEYAAQFF